MSFMIDLRSLLIPLANLLFSHYTSDIIIIVLLHVSIKVPLTLQLPTTSLLHFRALDLSVSVTVCFLCLIFKSIIPHFWIVYFILVLFLSPWDDMLLRMLKTVVWWLFHSLRSIHVHEVVCILNGNHDEEEAQLGVDQQEELNSDHQPDENSLVIDVDDDIKIEID
ncbi:hypothetical protein E3N88_15130 [Mikania micrantha]|uniref:Transmembrane protein n=1 Tax=Mikania micrantha TaxID=192012 RepID=A0A5N6NUI7_9ASTR|nr:hypothetical protein E3N88_15130 [Mikania micrantha]